MLALLEALYSIISKPFSNMGWNSRVAPRQFRAMYIGIDTNPDGQSLSVKNLS